MATTKGPDPELTKDGLAVTASTSSSKDVHDPIPLEGQTEHLPSFEHEKALALKFDIRILPMLAVMYLFNALDKGNLGNAKTDNMDKDLGFKGNQYNIMLSIFYVPYVLFAPPIGLLGKKYGPHRVLPIMMFTFGSMTLLASSTKNWGGMMALRWFLGKCSLCCCMLVEIDHIQEWPNPLSSRWSSTTLLLSIVVANLLVAWPYSMPLQTLQMPSPVS